MDEKERNSSLSCEIRQLVRKTQNVLSTSKDKLEICDNLSMIKRFLPYQEGTAYEKDIFLKNHYVQFMEFLLQTASLDWIQQLNKDQRKTLFEIFFLYGLHHDAFITLCLYMSKTSPSFKLNNCCSLLESFIKEHKLSEVIIYQCDKKLSSNLMREQTILFLVSLPDRAANKLKMSNYEIFYPQQYYKCLSEEILVSIQYFYDSLQSSNEENCPLEFLGQLVGRICIGGNANVLFDVIFPFLVKKLQESRQWQVIVNKLVLNVPARCLEIFLECLLKKTASSNVLGLFLGDSVLTNSKLNYLLTHKFIFVKYNKDLQFLSNIIGYLANISSQGALFMHTLFKLLDVWGDKGALQHSSYEQHLYITKAILLSIKYLSNDEKRTNGEKLVQKLMVAMPCHLENPHFKIRRLAMIVAEVLTKTLKKDDQEILKFEYETDQETEMLFSLKDEVSLKDINVTTSMINYSGDKLENSKKMEKESVLDSDDDLEPYDMSADTEYTKNSSPPLYLIDCFDGLMKEDNPDHFKFCIDNIEKLIRANPSNLSDMCINLSQLLLHLQDNFNTDNFAKLRFSALVAITVLCPIKVANYLTEEFYDRNYNTKQRMDILDILAAAAQQLSLPFDNTVIAEHTTVYRCQLYPPTKIQDKEKYWKNVVQKRIEAKTRFFSQRKKDLSSSPLPPLANRFAKVASYFFFPLLNNYDKTFHTLDLLVDDYLLLGRMLYTLGIITHAAINTQICLHMSIRLFEFIWTIRFHKEPFVRQSLLFAMSMVLISVPRHALVSELQDEVLEAKQWLEDIIKNQADKESQQLAVQCIIILENLLKKELFQQE